MIGDQFFYVRGVATYFHRSSKNLHIDHFELLTENYPATFEP